MREFVYSLATVAGFVGLATLYQHGQNVNSDSRVRRDAEVLDMAIDSAEDSFFNNSEMATQADDFEFMETLGWFEDNADIPEEFIEDVKFYKEESSNDEQTVRNSNNNSQRTIGLKCIRNPKCKYGAQVAYMKRGNDYYEFCRTNPEEYAAFNALVIASTENEEGFCVLDSEAPVENQCTEQEADTYFNANGEQCEAQDCISRSIHEDGSLSGSTISSNPAVNALMLSTAEVSSSMNEVSQVNFDNINVGNSAFGRNSAGFKFFHIQPNGIPITDIGMYRQRYGNYWNFFKYFNQQYMGIGKAGIRNRSNVHCWFLRHDRELRPVTRKPVKIGAGKFPWERLNPMMSKVAPIVNIPRIVNAAETVLAAIDAGSMASSFEQGSDCLIMWFHQALPGDILDLALDDVKENIMRPLDNACTVVHILVGMGSQKLDMGRTRDVWRYLQTHLQPNQETAFVADSGLKGMYWVPSLNQLNPANLKARGLARQIYTYYTLDSHRCLCMLASNKDETSKSTIASIMAANSADNYDTGLWGEYDSYDTTTMDYAAAYTTQPYDRANEIALETTAAEAEVTTAPVVVDDGTTAAPEEEATTTTEPLPDHQCCGRGAGGQQYNYANQVCCPGADGTASVSDGMWCQ